MEPHILDPAEHRNPQMSGLTLRTIINPTSIVLLAIVGQMLMQFSHIQISSDARVVNIAGRPRITKAALAYQQTAGSATQDQWLEQLEQSVALWATSHEGLQQGGAISKNLIEAHGGELWFESVVGQGTTFFFELPLDKSSVKAAVMPGAPL